MSEIARVNGATFDVVVIGGGIIGAGVARDAAMRGLGVALFEKEDYCYGTSAESSRLIHGGLRYLEMYDFGLVREDLRERELLLRAAPHLVFPLPFLLPIYHGSLFYWLKLRAGMLLYDLLSAGKTLPNHRFLTRDETLERMPALSPLGLQGAALYYDATAPRTERLCMENVVSAWQHGAQAFNHAEVVGLIREDGRVLGVEVVDRLTGETFSVRARTVINATGPWLDETAELLGVERDHLIRRTKGAHLVTPKVGDDAVVLFAPQDGRLLFVIPWLGCSYVGTTDTDFEGDPDLVHATPDDVEYLLTAVRHAFPEESWDTIYYTTAGVRSLVRSEGVPESQVTRKHVIYDHGAHGGIAGLYSIVGGKLTAYRAIAEDAVDAACRDLGVCRPSRTTTTPLPGGRMADFDSYLVREVTEGVERYPLDAQQLDHLIRLYGTRYVEVADLTLRDPSLAERLHPDYTDCPAQLIHAVQVEQARSLADYMLRRSDAGLSEEQGVDLAPRVAVRMAPLLGWDDVQLGREVDVYLSRVGLNWEYKDEGGVLRT